MVSTKKPPEYNSEFSTQKSRNDSELLKSRSVIRFDPLYINVLTLALRITNSDILMEHQFPDPTETTVIIDRA